MVWQLNSPVFVLQCHALCARHAGGKALMHCPATAISNCKRAHPCCVAPPSSPVIDRPGCPGYPGKDVLAVLVVLTTLGRMSWLVCIAMAQLQC